MKAEGGFPHAPGSPAGEGLSSCLQCSHNSWICGPWMADWRRCWALGPLCGQAFPQEAYNYSGSFSLCCVAFNRQSGVGAPDQTQHAGADSHGGPHHLPLPGELLPPSGPSSYPWRGADCRFQEPGGREGAKRLLGWGLRGFGVPEIRQRVQASRRAGGGQLPSVHGLKVRPEKGCAPAAP